jgi:predicted DNA-binding protein
MDSLSKFERLLQFRVPVNLSDAIDAASKRRCQSKSDYVRQSIIERLHSDNVEIGKCPRRMPARCMTS